MLGAEVDDGWLLVEHDDLSKLRLQPSKAMGKIPQHASKSPQVRNLLEARTVLSKPRLPSAEQPQPAEQVGGLAHVVPEIYSMSPRSTPKSAADYMDPEFKD